MYNPHSLYTGPGGARLPALERNILKYRAFPDTALPFLRRTDQIIRPKHDRPEAKESKEKYEDSARTCRGRRHLVTSRE
jgi:hypothetical protein